MKKVLIIIAAAFVSLAADAQIVSSRSTSVIKEVVVADPSPYRSGIYADLGIGTFTGDAKDTGLALDLGFRWTKMFTPNIGWDVFKISAQTDTKNFTETLNVQAKSGVRGVSPVLFGKAGTVYGNFGLGYGYYTDIEEGGFVWEVGAGVNFNSTVSLGVVYNNANYSIGSRYGDETVKIGIVSLRLGLKL